MVNYKMLKQEKSTGKILAKDLKVKTIKIKTLIINNALKSKNMSQALRAEAYITDIDNEVNTVLFLLLFR